MKSRSGFALAVVILVTVVALIAALSAATLATITARQTSTSERRATLALMAAESGLNTVVERSKTTKYELLSSDTSIQAWLQRVGLNSYSLPNGATINLTALNETPTSATILSEGITADGSRRVVLMDYQIAPDVVPDLGLFANAALVTQGSLNSNSAVSTIIGRTSDLDQWIFPDRVLDDALLGEYFVVSQDCGGATTDVTYKVIDDAGDEDGDGFIAVEQVHPGSCSTGTTSLASTTSGTLIPFATASDLDVNGVAVGTVWTQEIPVTDVTLYAVGNEIIIDDRVAVIDSVGDDTITITWGAGPGDAIAEATPIRREVPSALAETSCPSGPKADEKLPQGCYLQDLSNIWEKTFPTITKGEMLDLAKSYNQYYGPEADSEWPTSTLSNVTWIDGAQTGNFNSRGPKGGDTSGRGICGEGVVIINTGVYDSGSESAAINVNVDDCEFSGVLYVIGELGIQGNLDGFSGTIIVETDQGTKVQGTGTKSLYDPIAIRKALANLPPPVAPIGLVGGIPSTWRFGE